MTPNNLHHHRCWQPRRNLHHTKGLTLQKLRSLKGSRQLIVSTHNANVPVLGDADLVVTLEADGQHGRTVADGVGSLDDPTVSAAVEK
ncbi:hypothetical protein [Flaviflexus salsibiostraticola]|uniref:hypothetical protein n=1 Tax=Flaviflexus salsibiostraticola TaxID=1282737 RepID=UPI0013DDF707|nr:hypothetical protein [Flaviflexus salsibiostraticola]